MKKNVVVVGSGVIGLTCAVRLAEEEFPTIIKARAFPPYTTSNKAAAIWYPYDVGPPDKVKKWSRITYDHYRKLESEAEAGVKRVSLLFSQGAENGDPDWLDESYPYKRLGSGRFSFEVPFIHSRIFLEFLIRRFLSLGGQMIYEDVRSLAKICHEGLIVNCSGFGAKELAADECVFPIRGQVVRVRPTMCPAESLPYMADVTRQDPAYVFPRGDECIVGGTEERDDDFMTPRWETKDKIIQRGRCLEPRLEDCKILEDIVGLRPGRRKTKEGEELEVRLELESLEGAGQVIHNYGHGGAGFTLCWGCAEDVVKIARRL